MSESIRTWGLRLLALGIAIGFWFSISFEDREVLSERAIEASVSYNRPIGFVLIDPPGTVNVRVRGSSKQVRQLNPYMVSVQVDLPGTEGQAIVNLGPENVLMPEGLEVMGIDPNTIRVDLEREASQRITVVPEIVGEPAPGSRADKPEVYPNQVLVTGPASLLARTLSLGTRPVSVAGRNATFEETVAVVSPSALIQIVQPTKVSVRVPIEPADFQAPRSSQDDGAGEAQKEGP
ncbi:MAG TPA: CdaR family protein [Thermoanaerobaculia bacterium]|jgi:YbbR domain-containing protein|nr:CdaR family protein [Thermoanaerobaculia bacterium]